MTACARPSVVIQIELCLFCANKRRACIYYIIGRKRQHVCDKNIRGIRIRHEASIVLKRAISISSYVLHYQEKHII